MTAYELLMLSAMWALVANTDKHSTSAIIASVSSLGFTLCAIFKVLHG